MDEGLVKQFSPDMQARVAARLKTLDEMILDGRINPAWFQGKRVLDWEAGDCAFAVAFYLRGASYVAAIDSWLMPDLVPEALKRHPQFLIAKQTIREFQEEHAGAHFDFIFANTVTEHLQELPIDLRIVRDLLSNEGIFATNHDNYYQPVGHHDHGMLFYEGSEIKFQGVECWISDAKCDASAEHRELIGKKYPWTWNEQHEAQINPGNCTSCPYFKRSHPWAHLIYQDEFLKTWGKAFITHPKHGSLNKISPFQLRQFVIEAGMSVVFEHSSKVTNDIPRSLLASHHPEVLTTCMVWIASRSADQLALDARDLGLSGHGEDLRVG